jgi:hypothetical protein
MTPIPKKVAERLVSGIKRFQPVLQSAQTRDVNESDTVIIVTDMLSEVFGYDKYSEITSESAIRGTFCDLATKIDGVIQFLIEAKAVGQELRDSYVKQAVDYAANKGVDWVILTNGILWRIYKVTFTKPIDQELLCEVNFLSLVTKDPEALELLYLLTKDAWVKSALGDFYNQKQALSRFCLAAMVLSDPILGMLRREIKRVSPDVKIDREQIRHALEQEVLKRDVVEGEKADEARKKVARRSARLRPNKLVEPPSVLSPPPGATLPSVGIPLDPGASNPICG